MTNLLSNLFWNFVTAVSGVKIKRDDKVVLFGAWMGNKFADNSRFLYQYLYENKKKFGLNKIIWVTRKDSVNKMLCEMGYESVLCGTKESKYWHLKAGIHIICNASSDYPECHSDIDTRFSLGAKKINLWHGVAGVKGVCFASNDYLKKKQKHQIFYGIKEWMIANSDFFRKVRQAPGCWGDCYYIGPSVAEFNKLKSYFKIPDKKIIKSGYPRNTEVVKLLQHEQNVINIVNDFECSIMYLPTFRANDSKFDFTEVSQKLIPILKKNNILWIQKAHSVVEDKSLNKGYENNILTLDGDFDINVLTSKVSFVVTDYSSILADAVYHYKPVLLYVPDYQEYMNGDRGFSSDAEVIMSVGKKFFDIESLGEYIDKMHCCPDETKPDTYLTIRKRIWDENKTMEQIWEDIIQQINTSK